MRAYFYQCGIWTGTDSLWHGLGLNGRIKQARSGKGTGPFVVSLAGAGGKTSTIRRLAWEAVGRGLKVLVVTTTHMAPPRCVRRYLTAMQKKSGTFWNVAAWR